MSGTGSLALGPAEINPVTGPVLVGRTETAGAPLGHPSVSRRHAEVFLAGGRLVVRDLRSRFGTRVNGKGIQEHTLNAGDRVEFAAVAYVVAGLRLVRVEQAAGVQVEAKGLVIERGGQRLLTGVTLSIRPGQFVGLLGASGAGKSTLLKCLGGLLPPARGTLRIDDRLNLPGEIENYRPLVGYVPQDDVIYTGLTARENLDFSLRLRIGGQTAEERVAHVGQILERLRLGGHADKPAAVLSGGQRKRLNVGLELLVWPRILFLDEPTSGLDPAAETRLMKMLRGLAGSGVTVVCATHVMENLSLLDQVVVVAEGTVVYTGTPTCLLGRFGASSHADLYEKLEAGGGVSASTAEPATGTSRRGRSVLEDVNLVSVTVPRPEARPPRIDLASQVVVQALRGLWLIIRDRPLLLLLLGQPVLIGLLINLSQIKPDGLKALFLFAVVTAIWLGLTSTAREVVRDRRVYARERLLGVTPIGYLLAKMTLFGLVGAFQVALLLAIVRLTHRLPAETASDLAAWPSAYLWLVLWASYLSGLLLGLLVSTLSSSQEAAVAVLPLLVLPQLLLSGVATGLHADTSGNGAFGPLVVLVEKAGKPPPRGVSGWTLELASLPAYSRPALALLDDRPGGTRGSVPYVVPLADWLHLLLLQMLTAVVLVAVFHRRERLWLEHV